MHSFDNVAPAKAAQDSCAFCKSSRPLLLLSTAAGDSFLCPGCGGVHNRNVRRAAVYSKNYYLGHYAAIEAQQLERFREILQSIAPFVRCQALLDVGCGTGLLLKAAHQLGYRNCVGADADADAVEIAREKLAATGATVCLASERIDARFGVLAFMDSIGHIQNVDAVLSKLVAENLEPDGLLVIKTPHHARGYFAYGRFLELALRPLGKSTAVSEALLFLPNRYYLFTEEALRQFLARHGFAILCRTIENEYMRPTRDVGGLKDRVFHWLFRAIPEALWGKKTMIVAARRKSAA